jgi:FixJ family two-component response regulator
MNQQRRQVQQATVMIVDKDPDVLHALSFALQLEGFAVATFSDGEAFLAAPVPAGPACAIIDHDLESGTGISVAKELRRRGCGLPVILIANPITEPLLQAAAEAGIAAVLEKPLLGDSLCQAAAHAVSARLEPCMSKQPDRLPH